MSTTIQNQTALENDLRSQHLVSPSPKLMQGRKFISNDDDDESDYMDMSGPPVRKNKAFSSAEISLTKTLSNPASRSSSSPYKNNPFEDGDYADMSGRLGAKDNPPSVRSPQHHMLRDRAYTSASLGIDIRQARSATTKVKQPIAASKSVGDLAPATSRAAAGASLRGHSHSELTSSKMPLSPKKQESHFCEGGFYKDDEDDYAEMDELSSNVKSLHVSNQSLHSTAKTSSPTQLHQKSSSNQELYRQRSGGMLLKKNNDVAKTTASEPLPSVPNQSTLAGKASRKYLQSSMSHDKDYSMFEMKRTNSAGVALSPNRSGGVQSRIHRNRQYQSLNQDKSRSKDELNIQPPASPKQSDNHEKDDIIDMEEFMANNSNNQTNRSKNKSVEELHTDKSKMFNRDGSFQRMMKKSSDGSHMMKFIAEEKKSRSLDKNYMDWIVKTSPYASRTASTTSCTTETKQRHHSTSEVTQEDQLGNLSDVNKDLENDDDETFEQYKEKISRHQKAKEQKSSKKGGFWNRSKKDKSKSTDNLELGSTEEPNSPTTKASKKSKSWKSKSKKKKESLKNASVNEKDSSKNSPKSPTLKHPTDESKPETSIQNMNNSATLKSDIISAVKPPFSNSSIKRNEQSPRSSFTRSRISSASSIKSSKKSLMHDTPLNSKRGATLSALSVDNLNQKRNYSETTGHISELRSQQNLHHKRNKSDLSGSFPNKVSSALTLQPNPSSMIDISLASNYDDEEEPDSNIVISFKQKYSSKKSNTLGRIFGKKNKERKSLDQGNLWDDPNLSNMFDHRNSSEGSLLLYRKNSIDISLTKEKPAAQEYMEKSLLVHGFAFPPPESCFPNNEDRTSFSNKKKSSTLAPTNKYATITGFHSLRKNSPKSFKSRSENKTRPDPKDVEIVHHLEQNHLWNMENPENKDMMKENRTEGSEQNGSVTLAEEVNSVPDPNLYPIREKVFPISPCKNQETLEIAAILLHCIKSSQPSLLLEFKDLDYSSDDGAFVQPGDGKLEPEGFLPGCYARGDSLVRWLQDLIRAKRKFDQKEDIHFKSKVRPTRRQIAGMWQVILEDGTMAHIKCEEHFEDMNFYYGFHKDVLLPFHLEQRFESLNGESHRRKGETTSEAMLRLMPLWIEELDMTDLLAYLQTNFHDAMFRKALRKQPIRRTTSELKMIYEELLHINTIRHLSDSVKRELARVLKFESHSEVGKVLFNQGDEGTCWYIIIRGSVKVEVNGKGIVSTLHEGDDFGNLALMNSAPRSATIILDEPDCHFIKVDKADYFRILKDVEENTLRLKEHGKDVLVLEKVSPTSGESGERNNGILHPEYRTTPRRRVPTYSITAGTPERILEHILEYLQPWKLTFYDETLENFILMYSTFMKSDALFEILLSRYRAEESSTTPFDRSVKRKIVYFVIRWSHIVTYLKDDDATDGLLKELEDEVKNDSEEYPDYFQLLNEFSHVYRGDESSSESTEKTPSRLLLIEENVKLYQQPSNQAEFLQPLRLNDQTLMKVYNSEQTYATVKLPLSATAEEVVIAATEKLFSTNHEDVILVEAQESGDRIELSKEQRSVATAISMNSCLCVCENRDSFELLPKMPKSITAAQKFHFDDVSSLEIAYHVTQYDWHLFNNVHVLEYVYKVFGASKFQRITPNLDVLARRFNQLAYWPPTEICSCSNANKRAIILRKFIKIAQHLKRYQNMNAFMAVMIGIGNQAVSRLSATWEKLPAKYKRLVQDFETILDPSRNHHNYRVFACSMEPPYMPYFPLLMKDMTFQHQGNENQKQELVNFEKMHMISTSIRTIIRGCSSKTEEDSVFASTKTAEETKNYVQAMQVITDQKTLNEMSAQLEAKR